MQQQSTDQHTSAYSTEPAVQDRQSQSAKQPYQQPKLRCYGSVAQLTLGSGGTRRDGRFNNRAS